MRTVNIVCITPGYEYEFAVLLKEDGKAIKNIFAVNREQKEKIVKNWIENAIQDID